MVADPCLVVHGHKPVVVGAVADGDVHEGEDNYMAEVASSQEVRSSHTEQC